ncbi:sensor histidine kinase [Xanthomonas phaseoli]|uniref:Histidine kinase n=1 Tax=Xanthomonas manihotis TaxID=43353 RepID=A0A8I1XN57_XANMN|nr:histidine kinase [Xanthomonas phaseoli]KUF34701.1 histidine kinase [Xanthomonas phaseoli pv. manihotis]MBO9722297.1 histidine kinase [Xanthomonas phaseoli pv. manihotis]MBO9756074.1 histidine kinase [Xanthomonas phaseoli pv. manihotis]MBO9760461.1 histidine kinase [Xanthomonas phaseoli pv. manihotis]MBO9764666.1 histidine kinase [Xanthomonas phaseoli pv. manihotis]
MSASVFLIVRIVFAWAAALVVAGIMWAQLFGSIGPIYALACMVLLTLALMSSVTHVRRVRLIADRLDHTTLSTRQRRQIEVPLDVQASFAVMEEAVRALPRVQDIECAPGSLLIRAKVRRIDPYAGRQPSRWNLFARFAITHNQILATIAPGQGTSSVTVLCEPDAGAWVDLFAVDEGSNYENAEAINRAVVRRVGEQRRDEQAAAEQSVMEKELAVARLNLLHAQVEPHFLYNTLASAQVLARTDPPRAEIMIGHLIQYLRSSLPSADGAIATLGEELERTQAYLEILRIRMGTRLALQVEVPYELRALPLPSMMLQTLVENAIKHGLEAKPGGGTVWILARRHDDHVTLTVADDGQGFNTHSHGTGIGLKNLRERLQLIYAGKASFAIVSNFPSGVAATLSLPLPTQFAAAPPPPPLATAGAQAAHASQVRA